MSNGFESDMREATRLTVAGRLCEATAWLQRMLQGKAAQSGANQATGPQGTIIDGVAEQTEMPDAFPLPRLGPPLSTGAFRSASRSAEGRPQSLIADRLRSFLDQARRGEFHLPGGSTAPAPSEAPAPLPAGAQFLAGTFSNQAGSRPYKLYVPSAYQGQPVPLIVMLHGCTQSADDFAAGTRMNAVAEEHTCLVVYPEQTTSANASKCWNWFKVDDQRRDQGEPSLIAGITRQVIREYCVDPQRVYVAGLSAGGAAAAIMATTYPDLYAAVGVHSGLASGAACDLRSAFAAMRQGAHGTLHGRDGSSPSMVPAIVFHGDQDTTVHPINGNQIITYSVAAMGTPLEKKEQHGRVPGGHSYNRTLYNYMGERTVFEHWTIHGAGHAWSGGSAAGSYTDPQGPDATREMIRFFLDHPKG